MTALRGLVKALDEAGILVMAPASYPEISGIADDSRQVVPGTLFCAVEGTQGDGHAYLAEAVTAGATVALVTKRVDVDIPQVLCRDSRRAASIAAAHWFGYPARDLTMLAVTGTNGKTTTVSLIRHVLNAAGCTGSLGTLGALDGTGASLHGHDALTTPGTVELQAVLAAFRERGVDTVVLEASSHALDQGRLAMVELAVGVFTNLTHEHLDYHQDFDGYFAAKSRLIDYLEDGGAAVVNAEDPAWEQLPLGTRHRRITFGTSDADVSVTVVRYERTHSDVRMRFGDREYAVTVPLPGHFNVSNAAAAAAAAFAIGVDPSMIVDRLRTATPVAGRMEPLVRNEFSVIRDYAHTPDALERAITALRPVTSGRLVVLFGAGGDRDRAKRPAMGAIAASLADVVVITSDNPRTEDPDAILDEIERGIPTTDHVRITDRREAVHHAVALLEPGDCLLLAGKGHETYQVVGTASLPFDEQQIVEEALHARGTA